MRRAACTFAVVLAVATPAAAQEARLAPAPVALVRAPATHAGADAPPILLVRAPAALDLPARAPWLASPLRPSPRPREVKLSEEGLVLVVASCIIGGVILIYLVSRAT